MRRAPMRTITLDCHHEAAAQASDEAVSTRLATAIESPRVSVSISVTKPSVAKNAADARNAAADAAGTPRRAVSVSAHRDESLRRWTAEDLEVAFSRTRRTGEVETLTRAWVVWHLIEHDLHRGGQISQILGCNGIPALDL